MSNMVNRGNTRGLMRGNPNGFKKGQIANPSGRCTAATELARRIRERLPNGKLLIDYAEACLMGKETIEYEGVTIKIPDDEKSRAYCHAWLTERGWGRPKQELVIADKRAEDPDKPDVRSLSLEALRQLAEGATEEPDGDGVH